MSVSTEEAPQVESFVAANVIIITSGRYQAVTSGSLDRCVRAVRASKKNPILVLGPDGDDFLRDSSALDECDLVFDPNFIDSAQNVFSSVKAGLHATNGAALIVVLSSTSPSSEDFYQLERLLLQPEYRACDFVEQLTQDNNLFCLVTAKGVQRLRGLPADTNWQTADLVASVAVIGPVNRALLSVGT